MYAQGCGAGGGGVGGRSPDGDGDDDGGDGDEDDPPVPDVVPEPLLRCDTDKNKFKPVVRTAGRSDSLKL